jgi:glycosyltransferase involved in cell wall biosynthesis
MSPKITVVMCFYNSENYIEEALISLLNQVFKEFQLILIDDGSTDKSNELIQPILPRFSNIKYIRQQNKGLNESRNIGFSLVSGSSEFVIFLDSDDTFHPELLQKLYYEAKKSDGCSAVYCNHRKFSEHSETNDNYGTQYDYILGIPIRVSKRSILNKLDILACQHRMLEATTLINVNAFRNIGGWDVINFPKGNTIGEAISLLIKLYKEGDIIYLNEELYNYRIHPNQITSVNLSNDRSLLLLKNFAIDQFLIKELYAKCLINNMNSILHFKESWKHTVKNNFGEFLKEFLIVIYKIAHQSVLYSFLIIKRNIK